MFSWQGAQVGRKPEGCGVITSHVISEEIKEQGDVTLLQLPSRNQSVRVEVSEPARNTFTVNHHKKADGRYELVFTVKLTRRER